MTKRKKGQLRVSNTICTCYDQKQPLAYFVRYIVLLATGVESSSVTYTMTKLIYKLVRTTKDTIYSP